MNKITERSLTILLPNYTNVRHFLRILEGTSYLLYHDTYDAIRNQIGTHQEELVWKNPDTWIPKRLRSEEQLLAQRIWDASGHDLNPRYLRPVWSFVKKHHLQVWPVAEVMEMAKRGQKFLNEPEGRVVAEIDRHEGVLALLRLITDVGPGKRGDYSAGFSSFCETSTTSRGPSSIKKALYRRLKNLMGRDYVRRHHHVYEITDRGLQYLNLYTDLSCD
jgi:hypothetical protein